MSPNFLREPITIPLKANSSAKAGTIAVSMSILRDANIVSDYAATIISYSLIIVFCIAGFVSYIVLAKNDKNFFKISDKKDGIVSELSLKEKMTAIDGRMELNLQSMYAKISPRINANGICDIF